MRLLVCLVAQWVPAGALAAQLEELQRAGWNLLASVCSPPRKPGCRNGDVPAAGEAILRGELPPSDFWAFDEIHKYRLWRGFLKGLYDARRPRQRILVPGRAPLDFYRHGGDS